MPHPTLPHDVTKRLLRCARGDEPCDLVLKNARIINVFTGEITDGDIGISDGFIAGIGNYHGTRETDMHQRHVSPGFIEGHIHIESTHLTPDHFCEAILPHGTTTVICDPHEIANVAGIKGITYLLDASRDLPVSVYAMAPSCVPATSMETAGARIDNRELEELFNHPRVLGLAELMNFPGTIAGVPEILTKIDITRKRRGDMIDGHAPGLRGPDLQAYRAAGISSDHECTTLEEAAEKLRLGMYIYIREGSTAKNLRELLPLVTAATERYCLLVSDDLDPRDLHTDGHLDRILRKGVELGLDPVTAIKLVTVNPAQRFGLTDRGAIAPGRLADLVVLSDLSQFTIDQVYCQGKLVVENGKTDLNRGISRFPVPAALTSSVHLDFSRIDFSIPVEKDNATANVRVIGLVENQLLTRCLIKKPKILHNFAIADPKQDLVKIAVIERHHASGKMTTSFIEGFGLQHGAIASTIAHDSHNLIIIGTSDDEMRLAAKTVAAMQGGLAVIKGDTVLAQVSLPIAGLLAEQSAQSMANQWDMLHKAARSLGCKLVNPFMAMSFLALPVIPELKITDSGLVNVNTFSFVSFWA